jgi:hypothetical protein
MKIFKTLLFLLPILFASCGKHIIVNYGGTGTSNGNLNLLPSKSLNNASLLVNGKLLVEKEHVRKITVQNLPEGKNDLHFTCDNAMLKEKVDFYSTIEVKGGSDQTKLIEVPPTSDGYWINTGLGTLGGFIALFTIWLID